MYFGTKNYLKNNRNHTTKQALRDEISNIIHINRMFDIIIIIIFKIYFI